MKNKLIFSILLTLNIFFVGCINDLNVSSIDPNTTDQFNQEGVFAKIYATLSLTGQQGPSGQGDVQGIDEGTSAFVRLIWNLNELTTDEAICSWGDPGIPEMNFNKWNSEHSQITGLYYRFYYDITLCNEFLTNIKDLTDDKSVKERAEARFIRALNYYYLLDMYGNVPFSLEVSNISPKQISRSELFTWLEGELKDLETNLYDAKQAPYYRVDKVANWLLLSRLYLNAKVYTGTAQWENAAIYSDKVIKSAYGTGLKNVPYSNLFMADNAGSFDGSTNPAPDEIILPIACDGFYTTSWGSSMFLIGSTHNSDMHAWGSSEGWAGNRARAALANKFLPDGLPTSDSIQLADKLPTLAKDDRALFYAANKRTIEISNTGVFAQGLSVAKFSNVRTDGKKTRDVKYTDTDVPFMRAAEAYLTYAEAKFRSGGSMSDVLEAINVLRTRAHATLLTSVDLKGILDEWSREFYFEGRRRTDLIRFDCYGGSDYSWDWKGGIKDGTKFSVNLNIFPIPAKDINANPNLKQNKGY